MSAINYELGRKPPPPPSSV